MKSKPYILTLILCVVLIGCGSSGGGGNSGGNPTPTPNATMQAGQWEFSFPATNSTVSYMEVNLQSSGADFSAPLTSSTGYGPYFSSTVPPQDWGIGGNPPFPAGFALCPSQSDNFGGVISSAFNAEAVGRNGIDYGDLTAPLPSSNPITSLSGQWSYSGSSPDYAPWLCVPGGASNSTFTAAYIPPLSGTYQGSFSNGTASFAFSQNGYTVTASGTFGGATLTITNTTLVGAVLYGSGTFGVIPFTFGAHILPGGKSLNIVILAGGTAYVGTLVN